MKIVSEPCSKTEGLNLGGFVVFSPLQFRKILIVELSSGIANGLGSRKKNNFFDSCEGNNCSVLVLFFFSVTDLLFALMSGKKGWQIFWTGLFQCYLNPPFRLWRGLSL